MPAKEVTRAVSTTSGTTWTSPSPPGVKIRRNTLDLPLLNASARTTTSVSDLGGSTSMRSPSGKRILGELSCTRTVSS